MATNGPKPVWTSERKKVNQSSPRALAFEGAARRPAAVAGNSARGTNRFSACEPTHSPGCSSATTDRTLPLYALQGRRPADPPGRDLARPERAKPFESGEFEKRQVSSKELSDC